MFLKLKKLINDENSIAEYADKAFVCGKRNNRIDVIQTNVYQELSSFKGSVK